MLKIYIQIQHFVQIVVFVQVITGVCGHRKLRMLHFMNGYVPGQTI